MEKLLECAHLSFLACASRTILIQVVIVRLTTTEMVVTKLSGVVTGLVRPMKLLFNVGGKLTHAAIHTDQLPDDILFLFLE